MKHSLLLSILLASLGSPFAWAQDIGEPAPPLVVQAWVKGQPVDVKAGTNIYVVEIWESVNLPCRTAITNLNAIQRRFKTNGVVVVGLSDEPVEALKKFVQTEGANIEYAVAADIHRHTALSYMSPVKQRGIPYAFVVGTNGLVLWHGSPFGVLNKALELITTGRFDAQLAAKREVASHQMEQYLILARKGDFRTKPAGNTLLENRTNDVSLLCDMAYQISTAPHLPKRDFTLAGQALDQAETLVANTTNKATVMGIRAVWLFASGKHDQGIYLAKQALASTSNPMDQKRIELLLHSMQEQMASAKANPSNTNTNHVAPASAPTPATAVTTNPPPGK